MNKTYYSVLEIKETATQDEIKSAFRTLVKKYHPDNIETGDVQKFKEVMEAYDILSDLEKRKKYDSSLKDYSTVNDCSDNKGTTSKNSTENAHYYQYASYTKTREESEYDLDEFIKNILRKCRQAEQLKEELINLKENPINLKKYQKIFNTEQEWYEKEEHITLKKTLKR